MPRSKFGAAKHCTEQKQNHTVSLYESSSDQSADDYSVAETSSPDSASGGMPDNLMVEADHGLLLLSQILYSLDSHIRFSGFNSSVSDQRDLFMIWLVLSYPIDVVVAIAIQRNETYPYPCVEESAYISPNNT